MCSAACPGHLEASGVDLSNAVAAAEPSTPAVAEADATGQAAFSFHAHNTADWQWAPQELAKADLSGAACVHTGSLALVREPGAAAVEASSRRSHRRPPSASTPTSDRCW
jgi:fructokinase